MSAKPRCHDCHHQRGPRSTAPVAAADHGSKEHPERAHEAQAKKPPCSCGCHTKGAAA